MLKNTSAQRYQTVLGLLLTALAGCTLELGPEEEREAMDRDDLWSLPMCTKISGTPQASCPSFEALWLNYPKNTTPGTSVASVNESLFGQTNSGEPRVMYEHTCALRVSIAMNQVAKQSDTGSIPQAYRYELDLADQDATFRWLHAKVGAPARMVTEQGRTKKTEDSFYALRAAELALYLWEVYGPPDYDMYFPKKQVIQTDTTAPAQFVAPTFSRDSDCREDGKRRRIGDIFSSTKGIVLFLYHHELDGSFAHIDLWDGARDRCALGAVGEYDTALEDAKHCYFDDWTTYRIYIWKLASVPPPKPIPDELERPINGRI